MNRAKLNFWIDIPMAISFIVCAISGLVLIYLMDLSVQVVRAFFLEKTL